jgi:hypothetical protein
MVLRLDLGTDAAMIRMRIVDVKIMNNDVELAKRNGQYKQEGRGTIPYMKAGMGHAAILPTMRGADQYKLPTITAEPGTDGRSAPIRLWAAGLILWPLISFILWAAW